MEDGGTALGQELAHCRKLAGLSQRKLAELSGVSNSMIASLERGRGSRGVKPVDPSPKTIKLLARPLATAPGDRLLVDEDHADAIYWRLMLAAGYGPRDMPLPAELPAIAERRTLYEVVPGALVDTNELRALVADLDRLRARVLSLLTPPPAPMPC